MDELLKNISNILLRILNYVGHHSEVDEKIIADASINYVGNIVQRQNKNIDPHSRFYLSNHSDTSLFIFLAVWNCRAISIQFESGLQEVRSCVV